MLIRILPSFLFLLALPAFAAGRLELRQLSLQLPGAPASVVASDVNGDGRQDLVVVVAFNQWDQVEVTESATMDDVEGLVEVMTIVPALMDRREVRVFLARADGGYEPGRALALPLSVLTLEAGPPGTPVVVLTDAGVSALRVDAAGALSLEPIIEDPPVMAGTGNFVSGLGLVRDLNDDGIGDLLLPGREGFAVYLGRDEGKGLARRAASRFPSPGESYRSVNNLEHRYPLPIVQDVNGDGRPDLVFRDPVKRWRFVRVLRNAGQGRFLPQANVTLGTGEEKGPSPVYLGDLDGDRTAEVVVQQSLDDEKEGSIRQEMKQVREPRSRLSFRRLGKDLVAAKEAYRSIDITGHAFEGGGDEGSSDSSEVNLPGGFQDLNGDGRQDLVTITMDLSLPKLMGSLATKRLNLQLDFHVWCQGEDGGFRAVKGLDLSGKFRLNFRDLRVSQLSLFSGDFDGDSRADFVQFGRGKAVTIHRGRADCSFPAAPDLTVTLREEPRDISLVQIRDLDGDGRSDLMVLQPQAPLEPGLAPPVRLDLYLSGLSGVAK